VTYSGTVTAAMEAAISGVPGIAFSLDAPEAHQGALDFLPAAHVAAQIVEQVVAHPFPSGLLLNVNIPYRSEDEQRGIAITRQGLRVYRDALVERTDPRGRSYFWIGGEAPTGVSEPGTDFWALSEGFVSVTPLQLDLTADEHIKTVESWNLSL
jgi:5'-nucleotidase